MNPTRFRLAASILIALISPVAAEVLEFRCVSISPRHPATDVFVHDVEAKKGGRPVDVRSFLNHERDKLTRTGTELVFTTGSDVASLEDPKKRIGRVEVPEGVASCIFVFCPPMGERGAAVQLVNDSAEAFPAGSIMFLNLAGEPLRLELEDKPFDCAADKQTLIIDPPVGERSSSAMRAFRKEDDQWVSVATGNWPHPGKKRVLQVATVDRSGRYVSVKGLRDIAGAP